VRAEAACYLSNSESPAHGMVLHEISTRERSLLMGWSNVQ
jgi:hypothetical protein